jgi:Glycosyl hydrolases family 28
MNLMGRSMSFRAVVLLLLVCAGSSSLYASDQASFHVMAVFNIRDYGATGKKADDAQGAIQKAIDAAGAAGGGVVYLPPGAYTSGTLRLRSHVNIYIESGATLFGSEDPAAFDSQRVKSKDALFFGEDVEDIAIGGRGTVDGQQKYFWAPDTIERSFSHKKLIVASGKSQMRSYPVGHPDRTVYPHLIWLGRCKNVSITGVSFLHSPSWTFAFYDCSRINVDSIYIYTSLKEAVWADGIDIVSCKDVSIANSTIATGDDCIVFVCGIDEWGPTSPCEHITVTNCRLSSASAAIKFSEGNNLVIRDILIDNCAIFDSNRGLTLQIATGGDISNVVISNITMDLHRFDWFWAGDGNAFNFEIKRTSEWNDEPRKPGEPGPGSIHNVIVHDVIVHCQGESTIWGHPESWLNGITFENIKFFISSDPASPYDTARDAISFRKIRNLKLRNIEVNWEKPAYDKWESALSLEDIDGLHVDGFTGNAAWPERNVPAIALNRVTDATLRNMEALPGANVFLKISGSDTHDIHLLGNDFHRAKVPYELDPDVKPGNVATLDNFLPAK